MSALIQHIMDCYTYINVKIADPRSADYIMFSTPFPTIGLILSYYYFSFKLGPQLMKPHKPFNLKTFLFFYNILQILVNVYLFYKGLRSSYIPLRSNLICDLVDNSEEFYFGSTYCCVWMYFWLKVLDCVDTVVMVLRKNNRQISFLHVHHHSVMILGGWLTVKYFPGGHILLIGTINCFVHCVMYFYYLMSALDPEYKKSIWWKKHLTKLQIAQFLILAIHAGVALVNPNCQFPKLPLLVFVVQDTHILFMFCQFYKKNYLSKPKKNQD